MTLAPSIRLLLVALGGALIAIAAFPQPWRRVPEGPAEVPQETISLLASMPEDKLAPALTRLADAIGRARGPAQVLVLQASAGETPLVIATPLDSSGDPTPSHWDSPWSAVNKVLESEPPRAAQLILGEEHGYYYLHQLVPLDAASSRFLLINQMTPTPSWIGARSAVLIAGASLAIIGVAARR